MTNSTRQAAWLIFSYTALAVAWGWRLRANDAPPARETALLEEARAGLARRVVGAPAHMQQAALLQLALLPDHEVRALQDWLRAGPEQRLRRLTVRQGPVASPSALSTALVFAEIESADAPPAEDSHLLISAAGDRLEERHKMAALERLAAQAAANQEDNLALEIRQRVCESDAAAWRHVLALVEAARAARRPAAALRVVNLWLAPGAGRLDSAQKEEALDLQGALLLEGGRHAEASRIALAELRALKLDAAVPARALERALLAARAAGESAELLPWIERHLRSFPEHQISVGRLASGQPPTAGYLRWLRESASIADLHHHSSIACDDLFRLAAAGETQVLARLRTLAAQTGRLEEFHGLLTALLGRVSAPEIARALAEGGAPAPARGFLTAQLQKAPAQREGWRVLTEIDILLRGTGQATMQWELFLKRFPGDVPALLRLAQAQQDNGQIPQALSTLKKIPEDRLDDSALRQIALLAARLDDLGASHHARQLLVQRAGKPRLSDVLALAALNEQRPDPEAQNVLAESLAAFPEHTAFHKALIGAPSDGAGSTFNTAGQPR